MTTSDLLLSRLGLKPMADLPNRGGFPFVGTLRDGRECVCKVVQGPTGWHTVAGAAFCDLVGWRHV